MRKYSKIYKIKPREKRGRFWVLSFFAGIFAIQMGCSLCCSSEPIQFETVFSYLISQLSYLVLPLVPLHLAIYLLHFRKANYDLKTFNKFFARINMKTKAGVSVLVMSIFLLIVLDDESKLENGKLLDLVIQSIAAAVAVMLFDCLKIQRNAVEDEGVVARAKHHVAPGLAVAYFRYIENVVKGAYEEDGTEISKPHEEALHEYIKENEIGSVRDWVSKKILILFPESDQIRGTVQEIAKREKEDGENHCLTLDPITHKYFSSGQPRTSVLNVIKIKDNEIKIPYSCSEGCFRNPLLKSKSIDCDQIQMHNRESLLGVTPSGLCEKIHERKEWQNNYVIFAENRPLNTLYQMVDSPESQISFTRKDFEVQFKLYYAELKRLIEEDDVCKNKVELFLYHDYEHKKSGNFSKNLKNKILEMKMRDQKDN
eukprot:GFUD01131176.1.p1 GENE.GFUD01131176.1~~GFUD01131176.1.p1  ORF type:complete len:427 (-),score=81.18 GFUD01131176.1:857-2137(-)